MGEELGTYTFKIGDVFRTVSCLFINCGASYYRFKILNLIFFSSE